MKSKTVTDIFRALTFYVPSWPLLLALAAAFSVFTNMLAAWTLNTDRGFISEMIHSLPLYLLAYSPVCIGWHQNQALGLILPVKGSIRCTALILFTFVLVPAAVLVPSELTYQLMSDKPFPVISTSLKVINLKSYTDSIIYLYLSNILNASISLWIVCRCTRQRVAKGILIPLVFNFSIGLIFGIILTAFVLDGGEAEAEQILDCLRNTAIAFIAPFYIIISIIAAIFSCRTLCRKQM